jgi:hypothetical protein
MPRQIYKCILIAVLAAGLGGGTASGQASSQNSSKVGDTPNGHVRPSATEGPREVSNPPGGTNDTGLQRDRTPAPPQNTGSTRDLGEAAREAFVKIAQHPLRFYLATSTDNLCGDGCQRWIAAEGNFDREAPERLRRFLGQLKGQKLPIYFYSGGGLITQAMEIGRMLRQRKMRVGIAITIPQGCTLAKPDDEVCRHLKEKGSELPATMREVGALCASACVFAFLGGTTRWVAPGAALGVHSPLSYSRYPNGRIRALNAQLTHGVHSQMRQFIAEMGVDPRLLELAESVSFLDRRILNRDEIAGLKIDTRRFSETRWAVATSKDGKPLAYKAVTQAEPGGAHYSNRLIAFSCGTLSGRLVLRYQRDLKVGDIVDRSVTGDQIRIDFVDDPLPLKPVGARVLGDKEYRDALVTLARLRKATTSKNIAVTEQSGLTTRIIKLSTVGLSEALDVAATQCANGVK